MGKVFHNVGREMDHYD